MTWDYWLNLDDNSDSQQLDIEAESLEEAGLAIWDKWSGMGWDYAVLIDHEHGTGVEVELNKERADSVTVTSWGDWR